MLGNRGVRANLAPERDAREAEYIAALHQFFDDYSQKDFQSFVKRYVRAMYVGSGSRRA